MNHPRGEVVTSVRAREIGGGREREGGGGEGGLGGAGGRDGVEAYLSAQDAVHHDDDKALQGVEDGEEDLEQGRATVRDGQHGGHPGQGEQWQHHTGAPQRRPAAQPRDPA